MKQRTFFQLFVLLFIGQSALSWAQPQSLRWTGKDDNNADVSHVLDVIQSKTGISLSISDFVLLEDRPLAHNHFTMLAQTAGKVPIRSQGIRIWTSLETGDAIQVEALVDTPPAPAKLRMLTARSGLSSQATMNMVRETVRHHDDSRMRSTDWSDVWDKGELVRLVKVKGHHGVHTIGISLSQHKVVEHTYREFPQADRDDEFSIPVQVYNIYEEVAGVGTILPRVPSDLHYLKTQIARVTTDPYLPLRNQRYIDVKEDPLLGLTVDGRKQGYWSMTYIKQQAAQLLAQVPLSDNSYANGGVVLEGRYATVNLYPDVVQQFPKIGFTPLLSAIFKPDFRHMADQPGSDEMIPTATLHGRPILSADDAWTRVARRLPDNDPTTYLNDGFDELQVYWAVTQMFDSLHSMGWTDPELSTRRFNAFVYDADIEYRDNAFYTDDTINFTTYSPSQVNDARDNSTIWHELGHGVMDRLMGDQIQLADTGGLSEGMADFVAQLVLNDVTNGGDYPGKMNLRIFNSTGFFLTNEVHDDGEAYGGTMNDLLRLAMKQYGRLGLTMVTDLTLETMRLTRNNPGLTANDWFGHMQFADQLGNTPVRAPGQLAPLILQALSGRNFNLDGSTPASFTLKNGDTELTSSSLGSRNNPINLTLAPTDTANYHLTVSLKSTPGYQFKYPVTVKVQYTGGPLQGAIHWNGKAQSPVSYTLNSESDSLPLDVGAIGQCDAVNRPDGSCVDFAYVQIWNQGETVKPQAKKRFYLRIHPKVKS